MRIVTEIEKKTGDFTVHSFILWFMFLSHVCLDDSGTAKSESYLLGELGRSPLTTLCSFFLEPLYGVV